MYVLSFTIIRLPPAGRCGSRQPGAGPDPVSDHRLRLVSLWVKINLNYHNFMTSWRAVTAGALADMNTLEALFFPLRLLLCAIWSEETLQALVPDAGTVRAHCRTGSTGWGEGLRSRPRLLSSHSPSPARTLPLPGLFFSNYQPNLSHLSSSETVWV